MPGITEANGFLEQSKQITTVDAAAKLQGEIATFVKTNKDAESAACQIALIAYAQAGLFVAEDTPDKKTRKDRLVRVLEVQADRPATFFRLMKVCSFETNFDASFDSNELEKIIDQSIIDGVNTYFKSEFPTRLAATMMQTELEACVADASSNSPKLAETLKELLQKFLGTTDETEVKKIVDVAADKDFVAKFNQAATARLATLNKPAPVADPVIEVLFKFEHIFSDFKKTLEDSKAFPGITFEPGNPNKATIGGAQATATVTVEKSDVHGMVSVTGKKGGPAEKAFVAAHIADLLAARKITRDPMGKVVAIDNFKFKLNRNMIDINSKEGPDLTSDEKETILKALDKEFSDQFGAIYDAGSILKAGSVAPAVAATDDNNISAKLSSAPFLNHSNNSNRRHPVNSATDKENQSVSSPTPGKTS